MIFVVVTILFSHDGTSSVISGVVDLLMKSVMECKLHCGPCANVRVGILVGRALVGEVFLVLRVSLT